MGILFLCLSILASMATWPVPNASILYLFVAMVTST